jgi:hypothetical protein
MWKFSFVSLLVVVHFAKSKISGSPYLRRCSLEMVQNLSGTRFSWQKKRLHVSSSSMRWMLLAPSVLTGLWHSLQILLVVNLIHHFWINESGLIDRFAELLTSLLVMLSLVYVDSEVSGDREVQRTMLELLNQLDGFSSDERIKVIAATNRADILDPALMRSGRLDRKIEFLHPTEEA